MTIANTAAGASQRADRQTDLVPARMLNEFAYCPRLGYMEWVQGEFADSADTVDGRFQHRRVDRETGRLPPPESGDEEPETIHARSVMLSDDQIGAVARIDLIEGSGNKVTPVDYKRGYAPNIPEGAWEPERVQVCLQGLLLRANGYKTDRGVIYFVASRKRVAVPFDDALVARTMELLEETRQTAESGQIPPPLVDSPKCPRCSLVGICLPDEVNMLSAPDGKVSANDVRMMSPTRDSAAPFYIQTQGAVVGKSGDRLVVKVRGQPVGSARLMDTSQVAIFGNAQVTAQATRELCDRNIPICHFSYGGWLRGVTTGMAHKNVELRASQFAGAQSPDVYLPVAREMIFGKIKNSRTLLRRNHQQPPAATLKELNRLAERARSADSVDSLLGYEGAAARAYFSAFNGMLRSGASGFDFRTRNRRPPRDPVNAVLSFLYSMLIRQAMVTALAVGFDPYMGLYHQPKYGKPALALDLAEEFRPLVADSACLTLLNNGELSESQFIRRGGSVALVQEGRKKVIEAFERRLDSEVTHPLFGYAASYRRVMEIQTRLLGRYLLGELAAYPVFRTR